VIILWLNAIFLADSQNALFRVLGTLALTPTQRWDAARRFDSNFMVERWFILIGIIAIVVLSILFFVVSIKRTRLEQESGDRLFAEYASKRGLSRRERRMLLDIVRKAGLKQKDAIFTLGSAFERGVAKIVKESIGQQTDEAGKELRMELSFLREKLGFGRAPSFSTGAAAGSKKLSSRQIPLGRKVHMTRRRGGNSGEIESTIVRNSDTELSVKLTTPVNITFGEFWCMRYYFGASVWEFDTSVLSYDGNILVLNHSDNIRFINRRRFLRVPVRKPAFIARFPFSKVLAADSESGGSERDVAVWGPPEFVPCVVTELAGPGLRIESTLEVKAGQRVLVVFNLGQANERDSAASGRGSKAVTSKII